MTLTPVGAAARDFLIGFDGLWLAQKDGRSDLAAALRAVKLEYLVANRDPKLWSPWVLIGG